MLTTEQTLAKFAGAKLDANFRFWQRKLSLNSKLLTTFITPWARYSYRRLPFGISSAPEHFQKIMQKILAGLEGVETVKYMTFLFMEILMNSMTSN